MKHMNHVFLFGLLSVLALTQFAAADTKASGEISVNPMTVKGLVVGAKVKIDQAYANKYGKAVPAPFEFIIPRSKDVAIFVAYPPEVGGEFIKISFADNEKQLIENLRFTTMTIPVDETEKRLAMAEMLLVKRALPMAVKGYKNPKHIGTRRTKIGRYDAVEVFGQYVEPNLGLMLTRLVGILNPDSANCLMAFVNAVPKTASIETIDDLSLNCITAKSISTVRFINQ